LVAGAAVDLALFLALAAVTSSSCKQTHIRICQFNQPNRGYRGVGQAKPVIFIFPCTNDI
jgi:hypothetical protein